MRPFSSTAYPDRRRQLLAASVGLAVVLFLVLLYTPEEETPIGLTEAVLPKDRTLSEKKRHLQAGQFRIAVVADKDKRSRVGDQWHSVLRTGVLSRDPQSSQYSIVWEEEVTLVGQLNEASRGMELSELLHVAGHLFTVDDRSGIVYEIRDGKKMVPRYILNDGNGLQDKGFKGEWMTLKEGSIIVGSTGKEWTTPDGVVINNNPQFIKRIDPVTGMIRSEDWAFQYARLKEAAGIVSPGYLIHEAALWHPNKRLWYFFPRRESNERYDDQLDERRGTNLVLEASEDFSNVRALRLGPRILSHGFSSVKVIPGFPNEFIAIKSEEDGPNIGAYLTVLGLENTILLPETFISGSKYEGVEILEIGH